MILLLSLFLFILLRNAGFIFFLKFMKNIPFISIFENKEKLEL